MVDADYDKMFTASKSLSLPFYTIEMHLTLLLFLRILLALNFSLKSAFYSFYFKYNTYKLFWRDFKFVFSFNSNAI